MTSLRQAESQAWSKLLEATGVDQQLKPPFAAVTESKEQDFGYEELCQKLGFKPRRQHSQAPSYDENSPGENYIFTIEPRGVIANAGIFIRPAILKSESVLLQTLVHESAHALMNTLCPVNYVVFSNLKDSKQIGKYKEIGEGLAVALEVQTLGIDSFLKFSPVREMPQERRELALASLRSVQGILGKVDLFKSPEEVYVRVIEDGFRERGREVSAAELGVMPELDVKLLKEIYTSFYRRTADGEWEETQHQE